MVWKLDPNSPEQYQKIKKERSDGEWTSINIKILDNKIQGSFGGAVDEPGLDFSSNNFSSSAWFNLVTFGKIFIGTYINLFHFFSFMLYQESASY